MALAQQGDQKSYETLLREVLPMVRGFVDSRVGFLQASDDITQEVMLALHKGRHSYDVKQKFDTWLFSIARYKIVDFLRKAKKTNGLLTDGDINQIPSKEKDEKREESIQLLRKAVAELPAHYREAIEATKFEGWSVEEASSKLGISQANVKARCSRGYRILFKKLERLVHESA